MGIKEDASTIFHEMPTWGWWVGGLSAIGLYLYHARHHAQSASTLPGVPDALPTGGIPGAGGGSGSGGGGNIQITVAQDPTTATALAKLAAELAAEKKLIEELQKQGHGHPPPPWHWRPPPPHGHPPPPPPGVFPHPHPGPPPQPIPGVPSAYLGEMNDLRQDKISYYLAIGMPLPAQLRFGSPTAAFTPMAAPVAGQGYTLPHLSPLTAEQTAYLQQAVKKT